MKLLNVLLTVFILFYSQLASAESESRNLLEKFLKNTSTIQAKFQQKLVDPRGFLLQESAGDFTLKRPGRFIWDYVIPYEQKIISNGEKIWIYDSELEQVSVKKYEQVLTGAPVILLDQNKDLDQAFAIFDQGKKDGLNWLLLIPKSQDSDFKEVEIGLTANGLHTMKFVDNFEQVTVIEFQQLKLNEKLDDSLFLFIPPIGTDVVGDF